MSQAQTRRRDVPDGVEADMSETSGAASGAAPAMTPAPAGGAAPATAITADGGAPGTPAVPMTAPIPGGQMPGAPQAGTIGAADVSRTATAGDGNGLTPMEPTTDGRRFAHKVAEYIARSGLDLPPGAVGKIMEAAAQAATVIQPDRRAEEQQAQPEPTPEPAKDDPKPKPADEMAATLKDLARTVAALKGDLDGQRTAAVDRMITDATEPHLHGDGEQRRRYAEHLRGLVRGYLPSPDHADEAQVGAAVKQAMTQYPDFFRRPPDPMDGAFSATASAPAGSRPGGFGSPEEQERFIAATAAEMAQALP
jgi:hypothetical protein